MRPGFSAWTLFFGSGLLFLGFAGLASWSLSKMVAADPASIDRLNTTLRSRGLEVRWSSDAISVSPTEARDNWQFKDTVSEIWIRGRVGDYSVIQTAPSSGGAEESQQVRIEARAEALNPGSGSRRILDVQSRDGRIDIAEWDGDEVRDLEVSISVPPSLLRRIRVHSVSGEVNLRNINGETVEASAVSGSVTLSGVQAQALQLKTVSGDIETDRTSCLGLESTSVSGDVHLDCTGLASGLAQTVSGDISVHLSGAKPHIKTETLSGEILNRLSQEPSGPTNGPLLTLRSTSGDLRVE
jgi:DUF4097 and DUF4098 domain-containing protein YvlB